MELQTKRVENAFEWLENEFSHSGEIQSVDLLINKLDMLCNALPFVNSQMALTKRLLNEAKVKAYHRLQTSSAAQQKYYAPSLAKDYINSQCSEEQYNYDMCERCSRTIVHIIDAMRTAISALKQEQIISQYSQNVM
ncbi:hypothetical protein UFOVP153_20 [uncultured Caudovirales phage]|uniref:Uncharacterized protein n=1 Tax=uncultured Caudovirales phage TaxID=2100421 RepID=A0A6J5KUK9_9CAUD|nr:hypothetical protein UFOVP69_38 [uncultured Caudovirales phage]CAB5170436.1 hypothetical protein UFOVP153_20 [uncultured Caudovirales phage]